MKRDQQLVLHFLSAFNQHHGTSFKVVRWPDQDNRRTPAVEAVAADDAGTTLAFEHTLIQPFEGGKIDDVHFEEVLVPLENHPGLMKPGHNVNLSVKVGAIPNGVKRDALSIQVRERLAGILPTAEGRSIEAIRALDCSLSVLVDVERHDASEQDHVWVSRELPADSLNLVVRTALSRKLKKLVAEPATRHILLLEKADFVHGHAHIRIAIDEWAHEFPELKQVEEIWLVLTTLWETDSVLFFDELYPKIMGTKLMLDLKTAATRVLGAA
jgi:hypothetical protein